MLRRLHAHLLGGQMNQNLAIFSSAILKRRNIKLNILKETYTEPWKKLKVPAEIADGFMNMFPKSPRSLMEGMEHGIETLLCDVIVVLNIAAFLHLGSKCKPYFTWEMAKKFARSTVKLQIVDTTSFWNASRRGLKESPNKLIPAGFCSKLSSVKSSAQTRECFEV